MRKMDMPELGFILLSDDDVITASHCTTVEPGCAPDTGCVNHTDIGCGDNIQPMEPICPGHIICEDCPKHCSLQQATG